MSALTMDLEKGFVSATARPAASVSSPSHTDNAATNNASEYTPLELFQLLVGIHTPPCLTQAGDKLSTTDPGQRKGSRQDNLGLYQRTKNEERTSRLQFTCTSIISNTLYMLQILLAATFTGLSAYKETHAVTLTALGAVNTVLAGSLAWQKGQGVPLRYRKAQDQYAALLFDIEMTERAFFDIQNDPNNNVHLDPRAEKDRLQKQFDAAKADQQANYPDLYVSTGQAAQAAAKESKDLAKELETVKAEAAKAQTEMLARVDALTNQLTGKDSAKETEKGKDVIEKVTEK